VIAFCLAAMPDTTLSRVYDLPEQFTELLRADGHMPWPLRCRSLDRGPAVAGDPDECVVELRRLHDAGADSIGPWPSPADRGGELTAREVRPRL